MRRIPSAGLAAGLAAALIWAGAARAQLGPRITISPDPPVLGATAYYEVAGVPPSWVVLGYNWE